jgi:hypothetical protein
MSDFEQSLVCSTCIVIHRGAQSCCLTSFLLETCVYLVADLVVPLLAKTYMVTRDALQAYKSLREASTCSSF